MRVNCGVPSLSSSVAGLGVPILAGYSVQQHFDTTLHVCSIENLRLEIIFKAEVWESCFGNSSKINT